MTTLGSATAYLTSPGSPVVRTAPVVVDTYETAAVPVAAACARRPVYPVPKVVPTGPCGYEVPRLPTSEYEMQFDDTIWKIPGLKYKNPCLAEVAEEVEACARPVDACGLVKKKKKSIWGPGFWIFAFGLIIGIIGMILYLLKVSPNVTLWVMVAGFVILIIGLIWWMYEIYG